MNNQFKDNNTNSLDWIPEIITHITPAPQYHNPALNSGMSLKGQNKRRYIEGIEKAKNGVIQKRMMEERS